MHEQFRRVQEEYFRLRGQFSVGLITEQQFDQALHALSIQDEQGRFWMIGANTGKWYVYDGDQWSESDPTALNTPVTVHHALDPIAPQETDNPVRPGRGLAVPFIISSIILLLVAGIAYFVFNLNQIDFAKAEGLPTRRAPQTVVAVGPTKISPTPTLTRTPIIQTTANVTRVPITVTPPPLVIEPTSTLPAMTAIPTITPGGPVRNAPEPEIQLEQTSASPTPGIAQDIGGADAAGPDSAPQEAPQPAELAPDVYITGLRVSPNPPPQRQEVTFTATFLNTNPADVGMEWRVVFLDPSKQGRNKDWGQSQLVGISVPPGTHEFSLSYTPVTSTGPCIVLQALVARRLNDNGRFLLPGTQGGPFATNMTFC